MNDFHVGAFSVLIMVVIWILVYVPQHPYLPPHTESHRRTAKKIATIHKFMFCASIAMWVMATVHLGLLIQRLSFGKSTVWEAKAAVSLATLQVGIIYSTILSCL